MYLSSVLLVFVCVAASLLYMQGMPAWRVFIAPIFLLAFVQGALWATLYHKENKLTWF